MKKIFFVCLLFAVSSSYGQIRVALQHNGISTFFSSTQPLQDAYNAAADGDTLYLPGTTFDQLSIAKKLVIYGTGHYPDSTTATGISAINGIRFSTGGSGTFIEGVKINGDINNSNYEVKVDSITITKCYVSGSIQLYSHNFDIASPKCDNWRIYRNVINGSINCFDASNIIISNNFIGTGGGIQNIFENGLISNNVFLSINNWIFMNVFSSAIHNNIFILSSYFLNTGQFNSIQNNIFTQAPSIGNNTDLNNFYPVTQSSIFINQSGSAFDYDQNYHLQSPSTYLGTDGTEIGIYGGPYPYKEGAVPFNPHIISKAIPQSTDGSGNLNINIKVKAQNN